ncbi:MAG: hypothetical protein ABW000_01355 [Actinoplanes sp.]
MIPVIPGGADDHQSDDSALRSYRDTAHESFIPPPPGVIVGRARARVRNRVVLAAAAAVILVAGGVVIAARPGTGPKPDHPVEPPPPPTVISVVPTPSPPAPSTPPSSPSSDPVAADPPTSTSTPPSSSPATTPPLDLHDVKWDDYVLRFPSARDGNECPTGRHEITNGRWPESGDQGPGVISDSPVYGDLTGDGRDEAIMRISCFFAGGYTGDAAGQLIVVTARGQQRVGLGYAGPLAQTYKEIRVSGGKLVVTIQQRSSDVTQTRTYAWNGSKIVQVAGPTAFPTS